MIDRMVDGTLVDSEAQVVVIDEIGKMECFSRWFVAVVTGLLDGPTPVVATIGRRGGGFIARVRARPEVELWEVTVESRDAMPRRIVE